MILERLGVRDQLHLLLGSCWRALLLRGYSHVRVLVKSRKLIVHAENIKKKRICTQSRSAYIHTTPELHFDSELNAESAFKFLIITTATFSAQNSNCAPQSTSVSMCSGP